MRRFVKLTSVLAVLITAAGCRMPKGARPPETAAGVTEPSASIRCTDQTEEPAPTVVSRRVLEVPYVSQEGYPTGCESAAAVMLLRSAGSDMGMEEFVDRYLPRGTFRWEKGGFTAPHPADRFVGDPRSAAAFGCFAPVILRALEDCCPTGWAPVDETGLSMGELCRRHINQGRPVAVWATVDMKPVRRGTSWRVENTGETFTWPSGEHCLLLVGYDEGEDLYWFLDPWQGNGLMSWPREIAEARYEELGRQAVALRPTP